MYFVSKIIIIFSIIMLPSCGPTPGFSCLFLGEKCTATKPSEDIDQVPVWVKTFAKRNDVTVGTASGNSSNSEPNRQVPVLRRLSPEQFTGVFLGNVDHECEVNQYTNLYTCTFKDSYKVPLGGADFNLTTERDESTKINTVLTGRYGMWLRSENLANASIVEGANSTDISNFWTELSQTNLEDAPDPPGTAEPSEAHQRWEAQIDKLYWTFLSRAPTQAEKDILAEHFLAVRADPDYRWQFTQAWHQILYIFFMTTEFWHL